MKVKNSSNLIINLNNYELYNQKPICGEMFSFDINPEKLSSSNTISFYIGDDQLTAENVKLKLEYKEPYYRPYYFEVSQDLLDNIQNNQTHLHLYFKFTKDTEGIAKEADVMINDYKFYLSTEDVEYDTVITKDWIVLGTNYIKIIPKESMDIVTMKVYYE